MRREATLTKIQQIVSKMQQCSCDEDTFLTDLHLGQDEFYFPLFVDELEKAFGGDIPMEDADSWTTIRDVVDYCADRDIEQGFVNALTDGRMANWHAGDWACLGVKEHGKGYVKVLAGLAGCHTEHIKQMIRVSVAFPPECGLRAPTQNWTDYLECYRAAKRGERDPQELMHEVLDKDMSVAEIRWLYRDPDEKPVVLRFAATCSECGRQINYPRADKAGRVVKCGICGAVLGKVESYDAANGRH